MPPTTGPSARQPRQKSSLLRVRVLAQNAIPTEQTTVVLTTSGLLPGVNQLVERRQHNQRQQSRRYDPADHHRRQGALDLRADPGIQCHGNESQGSDQGEIESQGRLLTEKMERVNDRVETVDDKIDRVERKLETRLAVEDDEDREKSLPVSVEKPLEI